jgi:hypothetical protein
MAQGYDRVQQAAAAQEEQRKKWAEQSGIPQLWLKKGQEVTLRFLEQGPAVHNFARHEYTVPNPQNPSQPFRRMFTCLNDKDDGTACPGCAAGLKRKYRGVYNVIQRNRPVLRRDKENKAIKVNGEYVEDGYEDAVVVFDVPSTTFNELSKKDSAYNGLMTGDLKVSKTGAQFQPYSIEPADIANFATPMSDNDQVLAAKKHDLNKFMAPPTFQEAAQLVAQYGGGAVPPPQPVTQGGAPAPAPDDNNPFLAGVAPPPAAESA